MFRSCGHQTTVKDTSTRSNTGALRPVGQCFDFPIRKIECGFSTASACVCVGGKKKAFVETVGFEVWPEACTTCDCVDCGLCCVVQSNSETVSCSTHPQTHTHILSKGLGVCRVLMQEGPPCFLRVVHVSWSICIMNCGFRGNESETQSVY